jgi:transmembrane sensor
MKTYREVEEKASHWLAREDRGLDAHGRAMLEAWLSESTENCVAYLQLKAIWHRADRLAALRTPDLPLWRRAPRRSAVPVWQIAAALFLFLVVGAGAAFLYAVPRDTYATGVGEIQTVGLRDGSTIELNTNTHLETHITDAARTIRLDKGEAYFNVVHDVHRPFVVLAGNRKITDIGTKFVVHREGEDVNVTVVEGRVRVEALGGEKPVTVVGKANDVLVSKLDGTLVAQDSPQKIEKTMSWRHGLLLFDHETLADAAQEFNRYNQKQLVIVGNARDIRIGGVFRANNLDVFAALIKKGLGLKVENKDETIVVSKQ